MIRVATSLLSRDNSQFTNHRHNLVSGAFGLENEHRPEHNLNLWRGLQPLRR